MPVGRVALCRRSPRLTLRSFLSACLFVVVASTASADTIRLTVDRVLVWNQPTGVAVVVTQLARDQVVDVVRRVGDWYEIVIPSGAGRTRTGYIRVSQATIESTGPASPLVRAASAPAPRPGRLHAGFASLSAGYRLKGADIIRVSDAFEETYAEAGRLSARYLQTSGLTLDLLAGRTFWGPIGIGVGGSYHQREAPAKVEARVPHPFFFNQPRSTALDTGPLTAKEFALHVPVVVMPGANGRVRVVGFGGLSIFHARQTAVTGATLNDPYPHNAVTATSAVTEEKRGTVAGYHAGADVSYFFSRSTGIGAGVRYSRGTLGFKDDDGATTTGRAGGALVLAGVRFRF